jgi:hypothetical protein
MDIARKLGTLVFFAVPAIIGGGIIYAIFDANWVAVWVYQAVLLIFAGGMISK